MDGVLGVDGVEDNDDVRPRVRLLRRLTAVGVRRRVGVLKRPESACIGVVHRGVVGLLMPLSVDMPKRLGKRCQYHLIAMGGKAQKCTWIVNALNTHHARAADNRSLLACQPPPVIDRVSPHIGMCVC